jgi:hypothetical protein
VAGVSVIMSSADRMRSSIDSSRGLRLVVRLLAAAAALDVLTAVADVDADRDCAIGNDEYTTRPDADEATAAGTASVAEGVERGGSDESTTSVSPSCAANGYMCTSSHTCTTQAHTTRARTTRHVTHHQRQPEI